MQRRVHSLIWRSHGFSEHQMTFKALFPCKIMDHLFLFSFFFNLVFCFPFGIKGGSGSDGSAGHVLCLSCGSGSLRWCGGGNAGDVTLREISSQGLSHVSHLVVLEGQVLVLSRSTLGQDIHFPLCIWSGQDDKWLDVRRAYKVLVHKPESLN